jgi:hypothetical protein
MDNTVIFLGNGKSGSNISLKHRRIWTCNDWYTYRPKVNPERVYQIHDREEFEKVTEKMYRANGRYNDWRKRYTEANQIIVIDDYELPNQRYFDFNRAVHDFGTVFFGSSYSYAFVDAIWEGITKIEFVGIDLIGDEYMYQVRTMMKNIDSARSAGIEVIAECEKRWIEGIPVVDWARIPEDENPLAYGRRN